MLQVHANTYRTIINKASQEMSGFSWRNKSDRYVGHRAGFRFVTSITDWRNRRNELKDGYVSFIGDRSKQREAEALLRLWLVENGYKYELVRQEVSSDYFITDPITGARRRHTEMKTVGIKITYIPAQTERSAS